MLIHVKRRALPPLKYFFAGAWARQFQIAYKIVKSNRPKKAVFLLAKIDTSFLVDIITAYAIEFRKNVRNYARYRTSIFRFGFHWSFLQQNVELDCYNFRSCSFAYFLVDRFILNQGITMNSVYNAMINVYILGALLAIAIILLVVFAKKNK